MPELSKEISYRKVPGINENLYYRDDIARDAIDDHDDDICAAYDATATYAVDDLCMVNHQMYKCVTAVSQAEDFDSTKWVRVSVQGLYEDLGDYAHKSGAAVIITEDDTTPPTDTSVLWVYPES